MLVVAQCCAVSSTPPKAARDPDGDASPWAMHGGGAHGGGDEESVPTDARLAFFNETRHAYGRTALLLSGGAALGVYHTGLIRALVLQARPRSRAAPSCRSSRSHAPFCCPFRAPFVVRFVRSLWSVSRAVCGPFRVPFVVRFARAPGG